MLYMNMPYIQNRFIICACCKYGEAPAYNHTTSLTGLREPPVGLQVVLTHPISCSVPSCSTL